MHFYSALLTLFLASSVGATNTSSVFCPFDVPTTSFPIKLRSSAALSLHFHAPQLSVFNSSLPPSPILPLKQFVKETLVNVSQPIVDPFAAIEMEISMLAVVGWALLGILMNIAGVALIADAVPKLEAILAEFAEEEERDEDMDTPEMQQFLLEIIDFDLKEEMKKLDAGVEDQFSTPPPSPVEESHC